MNTAKGTVHFFQEGDGIIRMTGAVLPPMNIPNAGNIFPEKKDGTE